MGNVVVVNFVTLDGVAQSVLAQSEDTDGGFEHGGWVLPYIDPLVEKAMQDSTVGADGMLLGRRTYEIFAGIWPHADPANPAVAAMNAMPKYVASRTLTDLGWANSRVLGSDLPAKVRELEGDIVVFGSTGLLRTLTAHDLVDEYRLLVFPLLLGKGKRMFGEDAPLMRFNLVDTVASTTGVLINTYRRG